MGISAVAGLGAQMIQTSKADDRLAQLARDEAAAEEKSRTAATKTDRGAAAAEARRLADSRARLKAAATVPTPPRGFWYDLSNGGHGPSFHRVQMVLWTVILGLDFARSVIQVMPMPEFG